MKKIIIIILSLLITQLSFSASFTELQKIPHDSTNAENMKIWFPVKSAYCKVHLRILDSDLNQVRDLLYKKVSQGYYNIYWDKKDDSGNYVPEGRYKIGTVACDYKRLEPIMVRYASGENAVMFETNEDIKNPAIKLTLLQDSLHISLNIINNRKIHVESVFSDSLIVGEKVSFQWHPGSIAPTGKYFYKIKINEFEHLIPFKYKK